MDFVVFIHCYKQILPLSIGTHFSKYFIGQLGGGFVIVLNCRNFSAGRFISELMDYSIILKGAASLYTAC